jgi:hypothetical protein
MIGFVKSSTIIAILLFSASVAFAAGDNLRPAGGNNMHPAPGHGQATALTHVTNPAAVEAIGEVGKETKDDKEKLRILRVK